MAQEGLAPGMLDQGGPSCGAFEAMDSIGRAGALATIEPLGGEVNPDDPAESEGWSAAVSEKCRGHPEKPLAEAAREALAVP